MQFVSDWCTADRKVLVVFASTVLETLVKYRQGLDGQPEQGGVLLGMRRGKHLEVTIATPPGPLDRGSQFHFKREVLGHAQAASEAWHGSGQVVDYVGEWHTHPQLVPTPSNLDYREWRKISRKLPLKTGLLAVVVGIQKLHVELVFENGRCVLLPLVT